jgi:hypothetical protein
MDFREWLKQEKTYYHVTLADRVPSIRQKGLIPSDDPHWGGDLGATSINKVYTAKAPSHAIYYGLLKFRDTFLNNEWWAPAPILLKTRQEISSGTIDRGDKRSVWFEKIIPPNQIEVWWTNRGWLPLASATWIDEDIHYRLGDEGYEDWEGELIGEKLEDVLEDARKMLTPRA